MRNNEAAAKHHRLIYLLSVAHRRLQRWMAAQPQNTVTPAQAGLLFILGRQDGVLIGEAGAALDLGPAGISGLVDRTAAAGLIERRADREDGRAWRIWLTPKGRSALAQAKTSAGRGQRGADGRIHGCGDRHRRTLADEHSEQVSKRSRRMTEHVRIESNGGILTLTLARPDKKNALTDAMYGKLADTIESAEFDPSARVILIRGEGDMFTAGNDVGEFAAVAAGKSEGSRNVVRFIQSLARCTRPLVAAVQGRAVGVGTTMLLHCDLVVLADNAQLSTPFVSLALVPEAASSLLMPARIGYARAYEMFALGETVPARSALEWGLANRVVPLDKLDAEALALAQRLARQPLGALTATKKLMRNGEALVAQMQAEGEQFAQRLRTAEAREAFTAFAERRPPDFTKVA
ncbi:enoyl-CoA hydratase/carnithine racemase [Bradyrhizobium liaoningense]